MNKKNRLTVGFLSMLAAIGLLMAPNTSAADTSAKNVDRVDIVDDPKENKEQPDSTNPQDAAKRVMKGDDDELTRVDVKETDRDLEGPEYDKNKEPSH